MIDILVIADDLTGAADAGVMFCPFHRPVLLMTSLSFPSERMPQTSAAVLAVSTESRALSATDAHGQLRSCLDQWQQPMPPKRLFKKIDSSLRGNIGAEVDAIIEQTDATISFITAAFPELGRTTVKGIHRVHGIPVADTELRNDPVTPLRISNITAAVAVQSRYRVGHLDLESLDSSLPRLQRALESLRAQGCVHVTFDGTSKQHLDAVVALAENCNEKVLLVGTAGLAAAAARAWSPGVLLEEEVTQAAAPGHPLYVCGTAAARTHQQIEALVKAGPCTVVDLAPALLAQPLQQAERLREAERICREYPQQALVLRVAPSNRNHPALENFWTPDQIVSGLAEITRRMAEIQRPSALFCCGGDTASAVLQCLGVWGSQLSRVVRPGTVLGTLRGGLLDGVPLATKPGSFGKVQDLVELHTLLTHKRKGENQL